MWQAATALQSHLEQKVLLGSFSSFVMLKIVILFWEEISAVTLVKNFIIF